MNLINKNFKYIKKIIKNQNINSKKELISNNSHIFKNKLMNKHENNSGLKNNKSVILKKNQQKNFLTNDLESQI